jgi:hypothetical protein
MSDATSFIEGWKQDLSNFCDSVSHAKPIPDMLLKLAEELNVKIGETKLPPPVEIAHEYNEIMARLRKVDVPDGYTGGQFDLNIHKMTVQQRKELLSLMKKLCRKLQSTSGNQVSVFLKMWLKKTIFNIKK